MQIQVKRECASEVSLTGKAMGVGCGRSQVWVRIWPNV